MSKYLDLEGLEALVKFLTPLAGDGIEITKNEEKQAVISSTITAADLDAITSITANGADPLTLDATRSGTEVSITGSVDLSSKQDVLTAGAGIDITDNVVSCTLDNTVFRIVTALPTSDIDTNVIYVVIGEVTGEGENLFTEYIYVNGSWEKLGEFKADTDLSDYYTKEEVDEKIAEVESQIEDVNGDIVNDVKDLEEKISNLEDNLESTTTDLQSQIDTNKDLIEENTDSINSLLEQHQEDISNLQDEIDSLEAQHNEDVLSIEESITNLENTKQDNLTAGRGIDITDNVVSCTLDHDVFVYAGSTLPEHPEEEDVHKIFLINNNEKTSEDNNFIEYIWVGSSYTIGSWEKIGEFNAGIDLDSYYTKSEVDSKVDNLQSEIDANTETISQNTSDISALEIKHQSDIDSLNALVSDLTGVEHTDFENVLNLISGLQESVNTNTANIASNTSSIEANTSDIEANKNAIETNAADIADLTENKQDKLTAGTGISIDEINGENVIACTIDHTLYKIVPSLPSQPDEEDENKIFLVPNEITTEEENEFTEYIWVKSSTSEGEWEKIGEFKADVDLSDYATIDYVNSKVSDLQDQINTNTADIKGNTSAIEDNVSAISANASNIEANTSAIEKLQSDVETNAADIASNKEAIEALESKEGADLSELKEAIETNTSNIAANTSAIEGLQDNVATLESSKQDALTAGEMLSIYELNGVTYVDWNNDAKSRLESDENAITANTDAINANSDSITELQESKQDKLTAGTGIEITSDNTINVTLDTQIWEVVSSLDDVTDPQTNKIYCVRKEEDPDLHTNDIYVEYMWVDNNWEYVGEIQPEIDLTPYATIEYVDAADESLKNSIEANTNAIDALQTQVDNLESAEANDIESLKEQVETNTSNIATNTENIESLSDRTSTNETNISALLTIVSSVTDWEESEITTVAGLVSDVNDLKTAVETNTNNIATNTSDIESLKEQVETNANNISENAEAIEANKAAIETKQDVLTAGDGISINTINGENIIACTLDTTVFVVEGALPDHPSEEDVNKIYVVPTVGETGENNTFTEYIWIGTSYDIGGWEKVGEFKADVDLSDYYTKLEVDYILKDYATEDYVHDQIRNLEDEINERGGITAINATSVYPLTLTSITTNGITTIDGNIASGYYVTTSEFNQFVYDLNNEIGDLTNGLEEAISNEESRAQAAEETLLNNIDAEASTRESVDNTLQQNIDLEESARESADSTLLSNIDSETSARKEADEVLQTNIDNEASVRESADATLLSNIDSEAAAREDADSKLLDNIDTEETARKNADDTLQKEIDELSLNVEDTYETKADAKLSHDELQTAINEEATARDSADTTLLNNINTEATTRENADKELQAAINDEASARDEADEILQANIDAEATRAKKAEDELNSLISEEVARAQQAEAELQTSFTNAINALDYSDSITSGSFVTSVNETNGVISVTRAAIKNSDKTVTVASDSSGNVDLSVNIDGTTIVADSSTGTLSVPSSALTQYVGENAVAISGVDSNNNKTVSLVIDESDIVLSQSASGLKTTLTVDYTNTDHKINLRGIDGAIISSFDATEFIIDGMIEDVALVHENPNTGATGEFIEITWNIEGGQTKTVYLDVTELVDVYIAGDGLTLNDHTFSIKIADSDEGYLVVTSAGLKTEGISSAITNAVAEETSRAEAAEKTLEAAITTAQSAATTVVAKDSGASHLTLSSSTNSSTGATTYTIGESDIASASDLTALTTTVNTNVTNLQSQINTNANNISALQTEVATNTADITSLLTQVSSSTTDISALQSQVDTNTSSISSLQSSLSGKQDTLVAGNNISISGNTISAVDTTYSAGDNVSISNANVISVDLSNYAKETEITDLQSQINTNASNISTNANNIAANASAITSLETSKQDVLTAGSNITISGTTISATDTTYTAGNNVTISSSNAISVDLSSYAKSSDLSNYVTSTSLSSTLADYVTSSSLTSTLNNYATSSDLSSLEALIESVASDCITNIITNGSDELSLSASVSNGTATITGSVTLTVATNADIDALFD